MPIDIQWDKQHPDTLICDFSGNWTWQECRQATQVLHFLQEGKPQMSVNYICDLRHSTLQTEVCINRIEKLLAADFEPTPAQIILLDSEKRVDSLTPIAERHHDVQLAIDEASAYQQLNLLQL